MLHVTAAAELSTQNNWLQLYLHCYIVGTVYWYSTVCELCVTGLQVRSKCLGRRGEEGSGVVRGTAFITIIIIIIIIIIITKLTWLLREHSVRTAQ